MTAETFRTTIERLLSPVFDEERPGPQFYGDIVGAQEYRDGTADHVSGLTASGDQLTITLDAPAPDFLARLALPFTCPVPLGTQALRSGLNPEPPISGAGPYYLAEKIHRRLVVFLKNPNYQGPRAQPFDAIAIKMQTEPATAIDQVLNGELDAAILDGGAPLAGPGGAIANPWGPGERQRCGRRPAVVRRRSPWRGLPRPESDTTRVQRSLRPTWPSALALDRAAISSIWVTGPSADLLVPSVPGSSDRAGPIARPRGRSRARWRGRTFDVNMMGFPTAWGCGACRNFEVAVTGQLKAIGINVTVRHPEEDYPADALEPGSDIDLLGLGSGTEVPDPLALLGGLPEDQWIGEANLDEFERLQGLSGQARIAGAVAFARPLVDEQALVLPTGYPVFAFFVSERIGCGFVQPAIGAVDLLSLCVRDEAAAGSPSP